jgi:hypothetical protein
MANAAKYKAFGSEFTGIPESMVLEYDFANDGGAAGTIVLGLTDKKILVLDSRVMVSTACTSGGSATVKIGTTADDDAFMDTTSGAVASLVADYVNTETAGQNVVVASGQAINMVIGTAALTAGKIKVILRYMAA